MKLDDLRPSCWYPAALAGFAGGLSCGALFALFGPLPFMRALGAGIMMLSAAGLALSAAGLRLEDPRAFAMLAARARDGLVSLRRSRHEGGAAHVA